MARTIPVIPGTGASRIPSVTASVKVASRGITAMTLSTIQVINVGGHLLSENLQSLPSALRAHLSSLVESLQIEVEYSGIAPGIAGAGITVGHWLDIAHAIQAAYSRSVGFVVWHPLDTLCYTANALSFMFENLSKPVVLTGAQLPLGASRTDALTNLANACMLAAPGADRPSISEVVVCFAGRILRGSRARPVSGTHFDCFQSPNFPDLGTIGEHIHVKERLVRPSPKRDQRLSIDDRLCDGVIRLHTEVPAVQNLDCGSLCSAGRVEVRCGLPCRVRSLRMEHGRAHRMETRARSIRLLLSQGC
jgi:L-asparaginase/Glu-tRNA(Gln) amidotransferase subunit D